ncbi:hypothetical protein QQF64_000067 [Cirrhinus molitorella]|uniref:Uncharacterized protein n=1 Tax=Cirrhinus molitorella TaxID=172907 RepID=A0ABR3NW40_9TELE
MHQKHNVGLLQPAAVTIYEYYSPDRRCTKFYHPERKDGALYRLCKGDLCQCAEENCSFQKKNNTKEEERLNKACEGGMDYGSDIYELKVEQVLKEGTDEDVEGKVRSFFGSPNCRAPLLGKRQVVPHHGQIFWDLPKLGGSLQYIFGGITGLEYWPTREESLIQNIGSDTSASLTFSIALTKKGCAT